MPLRYILIELFLTIFAAIVYPIFRLVDWLDRPRKKATKADLFAQAEKLQASQQARAEDLRRAYARRRSNQEPSALYLQNARTRRRA